jgi:hypothetical protein
MDIQQTTQAPRSPQAQASLFALLPRQLPVFKHGPEDEEEVFQRLANRGAIYGRTH